MGRVIAQDNCDKPAIRRNLKRVRQIWGRLSKVNTTKGVTPIVLLYGSETRCLINTARRPLDSFLVEVARRITDMCPCKVKRQGKEELVYPHSANVLVATGLQPLRHYIDKRQTTIAKTIQGGDTDSSGQGRATKIVTKHNGTIKVVNDDHLPSMTVLLLRFTISKCNLSQTAHKQSPCEMKKHRLFESEKSQTSCTAPIDEVWSLTSGAGQLPALRSRGGPPWSTWYFLFRGAPQRVHKGSLHH